MTEFGYFLSSEEMRPDEMVQWARAGEQAGFRKVWVSDHYHPWADSQGQSPFVWSVVGGIAATTSLHVTTAVTCPTFRIHPAVIAQAAATSQVLAHGRFALGVGSGERLNEHILGQHWPPTDVRLEMLEEAIGIMRRLWDGETLVHHGRHYTVENATLYSRPEQGVPVYISAFGPKALGVAARLGDGFCCTMPAGDMVRQYREQGGKGPAQAGVKVCWGEDEESCVKLAHSLWRTSGVPGEISQELPMPAQFEQAAELVTPEMTAESVACGPDPDRHAEAIKKYVEAGYDEVYISQIGPDQAGFLRFFHSEVLPRLS